jgi:hypothetical protein
MFGQPAPAPNSLAPSFGPKWASAAPGAARATQVRSFYNRWRGTPYRWGGTSRSGIDCSAYLRQMYRDLFSVELPRTTRQQIRVGVPLELDPRRLERGLKPGDVIFYVNRGGIPNHVVTYAGNGLITHSVSGRGVVMEPISKIYGRRVAARRYLAPAQSGLVAGGTPSGPKSPRGAIEPLDPGEIQDIPCPPRYRPRPGEVRRYARRPVPLQAMAERDLCAVRALAAALRESSGPMAARNTARLDELARWLEDIDALESELSR